MSLFIYSELSQTLQWIFLNGKNHSQGKFLFIFSLGFLLGRDKKWVASVTRLFEYIWWNLLPGMVICPFPVRGQNTVLSPPTFHKPGGGLCRIYRQQHPGNSCIRAGGGSGSTAHIPLSQAGNPWCSRTGNQWAAVHRFAKSRARLKGLSRQHTHVGLSWGLNET